MAERSVNTPPRQTSTEEDSAPGEAASNLLEHMPCSTFTKLLAFLFVAFVEHCCGEPVAKNDKVHDFTHMKQQKDEPSTILL